MTGGLKDDIHLYFGCRDIGGRNGFVLFLAETEKSYGKFRAFFHKRSAYHARLDFTDAVRVQPGRRLKMENFWIKILIDLIAMGVGSFVFFWCVIHIKNMLLGVLVAVIGLAALCGGLVGLVVHIGRLWGLL